VPAAYRVGSQRKAGESKKKKGERRKRNQKERSASWESLFWKECEKTDTERNRKEKRCNRIGSDLKRKREKRSRADQNSEKINGHSFKGSQGIASEDVHSKGSKQEISMNVQVDKTSRREKKVGPGNRLHRRERKGTTNK